MNYNRKKLKYIYYFKKSGGIMENKLTQMFVLNLTLTL